MSPNVLPDIFNLPKMISYESNHKFKLGCVIFRKKKPIAMGFNQVEKTHPMMLRYQVKHSLRTHAELQALLGVRWDVDLSKCLLVVYREKKDGSLGDSKPCPTCQKIIRSMGIRNVMYTTEFGFAREKYI